jgi:hypothetical protein
VNPGYRTLVMPGMRLLSVVAALAVVAVGLIVSPAQAADPFGTDGCSGVQPGGYAEDGASNPYTIGFLYSGVKGKDKATYFATEGDLILSAAGTKTWSGTSGPAMRNLDGKVIGHWAYAFRQDTPNADTFGLVRIDKSVKSSPGVCHFGGPTGLYTSTSSTPFVVNFYGQGLPFVDVVPARSGIAYGGDDAQHVAMIGPAALFAAALGDSGAPVLANGQAVGIFTGGAVAGSQDGFVVARLKPAIARAQSKMGMKLTLLTARAL